MDQSESWIGKAMVAGLIILTIAGINALLSAKGEVARRIRFVLGALLLLGVCAIALAVAGPGGLALLLGVVGTIAWVIKGYGK